MFKGYDVINSFSLYRLFFSIYAMLIYLLSNILRPGRKCWEDRYKLNEWADERSGRRAYHGGVGDAVGVLQSEQSDSNP